MGIESARIIFQKFPLLFTVKRRTRKTSQENVILFRAHNNEKKRKEKKECKPNVLEAKTRTKKNYIRSIVENDVVFCTGPSSSGKSFIAALAFAAHKLLKDENDTIIVTRPLVCTGRDLGSLPGELNEKIKPYLQPMEENLRYFLGRDKFGYYFNTNRIRFEPLETMRGSTFHESYMILDEAQNCTLEQIKMFVTRMGKHSKVLINGDNKQTDIYGNKWFRLLYGKD